MVSYTENSPMTPIYRRTPPHGVNVVKLGVWKISYLSVDAFKSLLTRFSFRYLHVKRIRQPDGARRFDLCLDELEFQDKSVELLRILDRRGALVKVFRNGARENKSSFGDRLVSGRRESLKTVSINIAGMSSKRPELQMLLDVEEPDIVCLQETLLKRKDYRLLLSGYTTIERKMTDVDGSRGLSISVRNNCGFSLSEYESTDYFLAGVMEGLTEKKQLLTIMVVSVYIPCGATAKREALDQLCNFVRREKSKSVYNEIILMGDWNGIPSTTHREICKRGVSVDEEFLLCTRATRRIVRNRRYGRCIDFVISVKGNCILSQGPNRKWDLSDHLPVFAEIGICHTKCSKTRYVFDIEKCRLADMIEKISNEVGWNNALVESIDECNSNIQALIEKYSFEYHLKKAKEERKIMLYSPQTKKAVDKRRKFLWKWKDQGFTLDRYQELKRNAERLKNLDRKKCWNKYIEKGVKAYISNSSKELWRWIRTGMNTGRSSLVSKPVVDARSGKLALSKKDICDVWANHFRVLAQDVDGNSKRCWGRPIIGRLLDGCDDPLLWSEIIHSLKTTQRGKAPGVDGIPVDFYKMIQEDEVCMTPMSRCLFSYLTHVFDTGAIPEKWNTSVIVPVPKKGDLSRCDNYRGISLISTVCKLITKSVANRISSICERDKLLHRSQTGFRRLEECVSQATSLYEILRRRQLRNERTYCLFLDFSKAYDRVPHGALLYKLEAMGFHGRVLQYIKSLYKSPKAVVRIGDELSENFEYRIGVKQGCPASPILFNLYINDILNDIQGVEVQPSMPRIPGLLFADDAVIFADSAQELRSGIEKIEKWCHKWKMTLNIGKCGVMIVGEEDSNVFNFNGTPLPTVDRYTYLGLSITNHLSFDAIVEDRKEKARRAFFSMAGFLTRKNIPIPVKVQVVKSVLIPISTYGAELYGMSAQRVTPLQRVMDKAVRAILGAPSNFCRRAAFSELGLESLQTRVAKLRTRGFLKWRNSNTWISKLIETFPKARCSTWVSGTARWLKRFGGSVLEVPVPDHKKVILIGNVIKEREFSRDRSAIGRIRDRGKISLIPGKLLAVKNDLYSGWMALVRLRTGTFNLSYRMAAYGKINSRFRRICPFCGGGKETALHLLWACQQWAREREEAYNWIRLRDHIILRGLSASIQNPPEDDPSLLGVLLGGEWEAADPQRIEVLVASATFLRLIVKKRFLILKDLIEENSVSNN